MGFPFRLSREGRESCHVTLEIEVVDGVAYHEESAAFAVDLHIKDADFPLTFNDFRPYIFMSLDIFLDHFGVIDESESLAVSFHN